MTAGKRMKKGDKVKFVDMEGIEDYEFVKKNKVTKQKTYTVRAIKLSGGVLLKEFVIGFQDERFGPGFEQGILPHRLRVVRKRAKKPAAKPSPKKKATNASPKKKYTSKRK